MDIINSRDDSLGEFVMTSEHFNKVVYICSVQATINQATGKPRVPENIDYMSESKEQ